MTASTRGVFTFVGTAMVGVLLAGALPRISVGQEVKPSPGPQEKALSVCVLPAAMPRTGQARDGSPEGLDVAVVKLLAAKLERKIQFHWCASEACSWNCLREHRCDIVAGQAHGSGPAREVAWSIPFAGAQFGLVIPRDVKGIDSLADLRGKRVGVVAGTVALSARDHEVVRFKTRAEVLSQFHKANLTAAFMDADFTAWYLHQHPKVALRLVADYVPRERWNMGLAVRAESADLLVKINRALSQITRSGEIRKAYADHGVPYRVPFTGTARRVAADNTWKRIKDRGELVVSMDPANLPYSSAKKDLPGFDVELARALARELSVKLRIHWIDVHRETAIGELLDRECDLAFGAAVDPNAVEDEEELAGKVIYSEPYYGTGYLLLLRKDGPRARSLADLKGARSRRLGTEAGSIADYRLRQRGYLRRLFRNQLAVLKSLNDGGIDYAYLWANVVWKIHKSPDFKLEQVPGYVPEDHWNIAIAMRHGDEELKRHVDAALAKLVKNKTVARTLARYHMPYFPPFPTKKEAPSKVESGESRVQSQKKPTSFGLSTLDSRLSTERSSRQEVSERGLEPQMYRRETSRQGYGGVERVRSAGVLVVGLDHNNLPFSAVNPRPAGLDYEIAGLLARELGVSLRVYWAYSSHDSYPSKLATKKFCDVILGVMPDDRFGKRVLYSNPYYISRFQLVVPRGEGPTTLEQLEDTPLAVEQGVAVRGLQGQAIRPYPSLEAILEAVATGKVKAGYVISTLGPWLAQRRWPGKLSFVDLPGSVDRFPICAAVRKTDGDLKMAIDQALEKLARSGELARVFARWHIPYTAAKKGESFK
jgi:ABC-type amino acid transport substrate-binding protein